MVDYLYVDLETGNLKGAAKGILQNMPGQWFPVVWVDTMGDTSNARVMSTIDGIRSWMQSSRGQSIPSAAIIATPTDLTILDREPVLAAWKTLLKTGCTPQPFPYVQTINMGTQVLQVVYDLLGQWDTRPWLTQDQKLWVKIEHHPAKPGTIQLPGGISCEACDADPSDKEGKPVTPATPEGEGPPGGMGGGGGGGGGDPAPNGGGGAPSAPEPFPGPSGACEDGECSGGSGEPGADGNGEGDGEPSDSQSGGSWGIWYGGDE